MREAPAFQLATAGYQAVPFASGAAMLAEGAAFVELHWWPQHWPSALVIDRDVHE
jgi:hypothetical protein